MAVRIRLTRVGATKRPSYRVVAIDRRRARDGRALEILGFYDPLTEPATVQLNADRIQEWIGKGAQPSETVVKLMRQAGMAGAAPAPRAAPTPAKKATRRGKAAATEPEAATGPEAGAPGQGADEPAGAEGAGGEKAEA